MTKISASKDTVPSGNVKYFLGKITELTVSLTTEKFAEDFTVNFVDFTSQHSMQCMLFV